MNGNGTNQSHTDESVCVSPPQTASGSRRPLLTGQPSQSVQSVNSLMVNSTSNATHKRISWLIDKSKIRNILNDEERKIKSDRRSTEIACVDLEESDHILKHCNKLFLSLMDPNNLNSDLECTTTVDRSQVCNYHMGDNKFSLLHIAVLLENIEKLVTYLSEFCDDLTIDQLTGEHGISAMHIAAQGNYPEGINLLLQYKAVIDIPDSRGLTPLHQATYRKSTKATTHLIKRGAALNTMMTNQNLTTLALVLRNTPSAKQAIIERLDESITLNGDSVEDKIYIKFDFTQWKLSTGDEDQTQSVHAYDLVHVFAKEEKKFKSKRASDLIEHPLVQKMLEDAWTTKMWVTYGLIFIFKFIFMAMIAVYVWNGRQPRWLLNCLFGAAILDCVRNIIAVVSFATSPTATKWYTTLKKYYLTNFRFYCYWTRIIGSFVFFFLSEYEILLEMLSPMIFLAGWFDFILMFGEIRVFGLYMDMFFSVLKHFLKVLRAFSIFLIGFAICFWLYFHQQSSFSRLHLAMAKVIVMFIGEIDYNELISTYLNQTLTAPDGTMFDKSPSEAPQWYLVFPLTCICIYVIAMPIVLHGLLIGIVVSDISEINYKANAFQLKRSANHLEYAINSIDFIFCCCNFHDIILKARRVDNVVEVEYSFENNSQSEYLHLAYEIANKNASRVVQDSSSASGV